MHVDSDTWLISLRKGEKNPLGGGSGAAPVLPPIKGVLARLVSAALVLSLCPVLSFKDPLARSLATGGRRCWKWMRFPYPLYSLSLVAFLAPALSPTKCRRSATQVRRVGVSGAFGSEEMYRCGDNEVGEALLHPSRCPHSSFLHSAGPAAD